MKHTGFIWGAALALVAALSACGGGGGTSNNTTATASSTVSVGTVTGFGSVIVDGVRIDDSAATVSVENADGTTTPAETKLGQRVQVTYDANLKASTVVVMPELVAQVTAVDTSANTLTLGGVTVVVNTDASNPPVTVFDSPYTALADVQVGDWVEVHGIPKLDTTTGKYLIQATRIEQESAPPAYARIAGTVQSVDTTAQTFGIGGLTFSYANATIRPTSTALAAGQFVIVWVDATQALSTGTALPARFVRITHRTSSSTDAAANIGGVVAALDATAKTFTVDGVAVDASTAQILPANKTFADLQNGKYVRVAGTFNASGVLVASRVVLREFEFDYQIELHGDITDFTSLASFKVRGVPVDASSATIDLSACPTGTTALANGLFVEVSGNLATSGASRVVATAVKCESVVRGVSIVDRIGTASNVDTTGLTFTLTPANTSGGTPTPITVRWTSLTYFLGVTPATLAGATVDVQGVLDTTNNQVLALKVKARH